jgi:phenylpropionate dioxygenase-like ring-hydroxylating dioxygenase large terminal subunit
MLPFRTYQQILDDDNETIPPTFRQSPGTDGCPAEVPVAWYIERQFHEAEKAKLWSSSWQVACREEHIPNAGDQYVYDITDKSYLVVRGDDGAIRAFVNACLHRGRLLRDYSGTAHEIRCPFHAIAWTLDGNLKEIPGGDEFVQRNSCDWHLPEVAVGTWGGFVFINPDPAAQPLQDYLHVLSSHFERWPLDQRYLAKHVSKKIRCNWKVAQEAFMEAYHTSATHPQSVWSSGEGPTSQYDEFGVFSRAVTPRAVPSPNLKVKITEQRIIDGMLNRLNRSEAVVLPEGMTARQYYSNMMREELSRQIGDKAKALSTTELCDLIYYTVFPNFHPWGGYYQSIYLFKPNGDDHETCTMEFMLLAPFEGKRPDAAPIEYLDYDDSWTSKVGPRGRIFDQDSLNMPEVHRGLLTTRQKTIRLALRQEGKIRHFYKLYQAQMGLDECAPAPVLTS